MRARVVLVGMLFVLAVGGTAMAADHRTAAWTAGIPAVRAAVRYNGGSVLYDSTKPLSITGTVDGAPPDLADMQRRINAAQRVQGILDRLAHCTALREPADWPWVLYAGGGLENNAFCYVAGAMGISLGLVDTTKGDDDYLAFVLAHEMSHYLNGDQGEDPATPLNEEEVLAYLRTKPDEHPSKAETINKERLADVAGVSLMARAGYDPSAALRLTDDSLHQLLSDMIVPVAGIKVFADWLQRELTDDHGYLVQRRIWLAEAVRIAEGRGGDGAKKPWERQGAKAGEEIIGPDGGKMVWVPAGEFMMGSPDGEGAWDEHPQHRVRITKGFWLGKCEVTNEQYRAFCDATGRAFPERSRNGQKHPVVYVSWKDAKAYCDHYGLALPTEAQWEYAARGPEGRKYPWGNEWDAKKCCNGEHQGTGDVGTMPVGGLPAGDSWCGASDMAGNVWEWCNDWYDYSYYSSSPTDDPQGPGTGDERLLRGGSWYNNGYFCRSADRNCDGFPMVWSYHFIGFRVARNP